MKRFVLVIVPVFVMVVFTFFQCSVKGEGKGCDGIACDQIMISIGLTLEYADGQPVFLDSCKVFWISENRFLDKNVGDVLWERPREHGMYVIVSDIMHEELENRREVMRFTGYLNNEIVCERDVLVGADCCHVGYFGTESLTQVINKIKH